jgi:hypothetical protein
MEHTVTAKLKLQQMPRASVISCNFALPQGCNRTEASFPSAVV